MKYRRMSGCITVPGPPALICSTKVGTTLPLLPRTLPKRTVENDARRVHGLVGRDHDEPIDAVDLGRLGEHGTDANCRLCLRPGRAVGKNGSPDPTSAPASRSSSMISHDGDSLSLTMFRQAQSVG